MTARTLWFVAFETWESSDQRFIVSLVILAIVSVAMLGIINEFRGSDYLLKREFGFELAGVLRLAQKETRGISFAVILKLVIISPAPFLWRISKSWMMATSSWSVLCPIPLLEISRFPLLLPLAEMTLQQI
jgi:hypothetical protein